MNTIAEVAAERRDDVERGAEMEMHLASCLFRGFGEMCGYEVFEFLGRFHRVQLRAVVKPLGNAQRGIA